MWQAREHSQFARPLSRNRPYSLQQTLRFLIVIPMDIALLLIVIVLVGLLIKLL